MTREKLIEIGRKISNCLGTEEEIEKLISIFDKNVPMPNGSNLFFYPANTNKKKTILKDYNPTVEEVVDKCLAYEPIQL